MKTKPSSLHTLRELSVEQLALEAKKKRRTVEPKAPSGRATRAMSVRKTTYKGREIKITTTYDIRIGSRKVAGEIMVGHNGHVRYHGLPAYSFASAVDFTKQLVDQFPEDYPPRGGRARMAKRSYVTKKRRKKSASGRKSKSSSSPKATANTKAATKKKSSSNRKSKTGSSRKAR